MTIRFGVLWLCFIAAAAPVHPAAPVVKRVRFFPAPGAEQAMAGGRFTGSNVSRNAGFETLAEIRSAPPLGQWSEIPLKNDKVYRWLRYEGAEGSYGKIAEVEFYTADRKVSGPGVAYGAVTRFGNRSWQLAFDGKPATWFESDLPDGQFVGIDLGESATARTPAMEPAEGVYPSAVSVALKCPTPEAIIRYTLDGSTPDRSHGQLYSGPLRLEKTTTIVAASFLPGRAASPLAIHTYLVGSSAKPGLSTFHLGNSLTRTTEQMGRYARTAGYAHEYQLFVMPGAPTIKLWNVGLIAEKQKWEAAWNSVARVDDLTVQPRDFNVDEEADYSIRFFDLVRRKSPEMQPWLYVEWTEAQRQRPTDKGEEPSSQMRKLWPAETWQESMAAMLLYVEEVQLKIVQTYKSGKRPRVLPSAMAMGWIYDMIERGKFPGLPPGSFYPALYRDQVHPNANGAYLVDLTWYAAFYRESPEDRVLPVGTDWTPEQALILQRLAWDVIKNYPDCGLYEEGTKPVAAPRFSVVARPAGVTPVTLISSTPGAWFRYTLDGTTPTRTRGYLYCGVVTVQPGMKLKAVAFKSGMADSAVSEFRLD